VADSVAVKKTAIGKQPSMNEETKASEVESRDMLISENSKPPASGFVFLPLSRGLVWKFIGALVGLCGGIMVGVLGALITAVTWFTGEEWHGVLLKRDGTILLFLTIPLLIFGAHCLDLIEKKTKNR
jgi:hypothetical protein